MEYEYTFLLKTLHDMSRLCTYTHFHNFFLREEKVYTFYFIYLVLIFFIVIQLQLSAFSPHPSTPPQPNPPPSPTSTLPLDFVHVSFIVAPVDASQHYPLPTPLWLLLHCP